jgi:hypothetical protein
MVLMLPTTKTSPHITRSKSRNSRGLPESRPRHASLPIQRQTLKGCVYLNSWKSGKYYHSVLYPNTDISWRMPSSGMWHHVDLVWIHGSEEGISSIFRVEKSANEEQEWAVAQSSLKMEAIYSSETSVHTKSIRATSQKTTFFIFTSVKTSDPTDIID